MEFGSFALHGNIEVFVNFEVNVFAGHTAYSFREETCIENELAGIIGLNVEIFLNAEFQIVTGKLKVIGTKADFNAFEGSNSRTLSDAF
jgi:hypothetical protein